jgi:hypothetical protein
MKPNQSPLPAASPKRVHHTLLAACAAASVLAWGAIGVTTQTSPYGMSIASGHPRLWFNAARLAQARQWLQSHPFTPDTPIENAFLGLLNNNATYCRNAINYALGITIPDVATTNSSNEARWFGEEVYLTWDWCHGHMTASERQTLQDRWNYYNEQLRQKQWGGPDMYANNYHWGYLRNQMAWGIMSWGENPSAGTNLQDALVTRWQNRFVPYAGALGSGGVATEGSQYGPYLLGYSVIPFQSAEMHGRPIYDESGFHRAAVMNLIYSTTPGPSIHRGSGVSSGYELFPYSDDQFWRHGRSAHDVDFGSFMTMAAMRWGGSPLGRYARQWLNQVQPTRHRHVQAVDPGGAAESFSSLPLDYLASGPGVLYLRNSWSPTANALHLLLGDDMVGVGHSHDDWGFQIWRGGRWLTRETTAYSETIAGHAGGTAVSVNGVYAHNGIAMNGTFVSPNNYRSGPPRVLRLESTPSYAYAVTDLSAAYRATNRPQNDNPAVANVVREFVYLRGLETLVVFDRLASNAVGSTAAASIRKTFLTHFENAPQVTSARSVLGTNGSQALRLITLVPSDPTYRVIDEATNGGTAAIAQFRLEVETSGTAQSHFLHVLQARDTSAADITASVTEDANNYTVTLAHPTGGTAMVVFAKGMVSTGGSIAIGGGAPRAFHAGVQAVQVSQDGPVWGEGTVVAPLPPPPAPTSLRIAR